MEHPDPEKLDKLHSGGAVVQLDSEVAQNGDDLTAGGVGAYKPATEYPSDVVWFVTEFGPSRHPLAETVGMDLVLGRGECRIAIEGTAAPATGRRRTIGAGRRRSVSPNSHQGRSGTSGGGVVAVAIPTACSGVRRGE